VIHVQQSVPSHTERNDESSVFACKGKLVATFIRTYQKHQLFYCCTSVSI